MGAIFPDHMFLRVFCSGLFVSGDLAGGCA